MRKEAEARLHLSQGRGTKGTSNLTEVKDKPTGETAEIMAKKLGVSKNTYKDGIKIKKG